MYKQITLVLGLIVLMTACASRPAYERPIPAGTSGDYSASEPNLERQTERNAPMPIKNLLGAASAHIDKGELADAEKLLQRAQRLSPLDPGLYYYYAKLKVEQGQSSAARGMVNRALSLTNNRGTYYERIISLREELGMVN